VVGAGLKVEVVGLGIAVVFSVIREVCLEVGGVVSGVEVVGLGVNKGGFRVDAVCLASLGLSVPSSFNSSVIFNISFRTVFFLVTPNLLIRISCFLSFFPSDTFT